MIDGLIRFRFRSPCLLLHGIGLLALIAIYVWTALCLYVIDNKTGTENAWLAWIPIANIYLMCKMAGKPGWWLVLFLIPIVNIVILVIVVMKIAEARNKPSWLGILMIVPVANLVVPGILAFSD